MSSLPCFQTFAQVGAGDPTAVSSGAAAADLPGLRGHRAAYLGPRRVQLLLEYGRTGSRHPSSDCQSPARQAWRLPCAR